MCNYLVLSIYLLIFEQNRTNFIVHKKNTGIETKPTKTGHKSLVPNSCGNPAIFVIKIPITRKSWFSVPAKPLKFTGAISDKN